jgi:hypothetical protein
MGIAHYFVHITCIKVEGMEPEPPGPCAPTLSFRLVHLHCDQHVLPVHVYGIIMAAPWRTQITFQALALFPVFPIPRTILNWLALGLC